MLQKHHDEFNNRLLFVYKMLNGQIASPMHSNMMFWGLTSSMATQILLSSDLISYYVVKCHCTCGQRQSRRQNATHFIHEWLAFKINKSSILKLGRKLLSKIIRSIHRSVAAAKDHRSDDGNYSARPILLFKSSPFLHSCRPIRHFLC